MTAFVKKCGSASSINRYGGFQTPEGTIFRGMKAYMFICRGKISPGTACKKRFTIVK